MWFLQTDTLLILALLCLGMGLLSWAAGKKYPRLLRLFPLVDLTFLWYVSKKLAVFYIAYVLVTWAFILFLRTVKTGRKFWFSLLCLGCCFPLIYMRSAAFLPLPTMGLICIGIAYNMLKAIDLIYYEYFSGERGSFEVYVN